MKQLCIKYHSRFKRLLLLGNVAVGDSPPCDVPERAITRLGPVSVVQCDCHLTTCEFCAHVLLFLLLPGLLTRRRTVVYLACLLQIPTSPSLSPPTGQRDKRLHA